MIENFIGIVLRTIKYSDNLMIADIYTKSRGRVSFLLPVSHSKRAKVRSVLFQPLTMLSFLASYRMGKTMSRISDAQLYKSYTSIPYNIVKSSIALYLAEFLSLVLREEEGNGYIYDLIDNALTWFDFAQEGYADFHILFLLKLTLLLGIYPNVENYREGAYFDLAAGCLVYEHPLHGQFLSVEDTRNFVELMNMDFSSLHTFSLNRKARGEYLTLIHNYYRLHIPGFSEPKSADVLREFFS